jgi:hypothetical protein
VDLVKCNNRVEPPNRGIYLPHSYVPGRSSSTFSTSTYDMTTIGAGRSSVAAVRGITVGAQSHATKHAVNRCPVSRQIRNTSTTCSSSPVTSLSPLRYHIFSEPLPYLIGLKLQHEIIDRRLKLKAKNQQTDDIVLLLGKYALGVIGHKLIRRTHTNIYDWTT